MQNIILVSCLFCTVCCNNLGNDIMQTVKLLILELYNRLNIKVPVLSFSYICSSGLGLDVLALLNLSQLILTAEEMVQDKSILYSCRESVQYKEDC